MKAMECYRPSPVMSNNYSNWHCRHGHSVTLEPLDAGLLVYCHELVGDGICGKRMKRTLIVETNKYLVSR